MNGRESNAASCSPVAARTRKVSGRKIFRKRKEFAPHFKRHFLKWHLRVRVLHAQPYLRSQMFTTCRQRPIVDSETPTSARLNPSGSLKDRTGSSNRFSRES